MNEVINDKVNHPSHYTSGKIEVIDFIEDQNFNYHRGNAIKYIWRAGLKQENGMNNITKEIEDLNKAIWYIQDRIKQLKEIQKQSVDEKETKEDNR